MIIDRSQQKERAREREYAANAAKREWHKWFAWYPVQVPRFSGRWVWLHTIEQRWIHNIEISDTSGLFGGSTMYDWSHWDRRLITR